MELWHALVLALAAWGTLRILRAHRTESEKSLSTLHAAVETGRDQPASLHPFIDPGLCIGCGSCVAACPEKSVLGMVDGQARLIEPASCVGHGACEKACPTKAITLVLGTKKRGIDIPALQPDYQTTVPGVYVAGELGGMGLVRNAVRQGVTAVRGMGLQASGRGLDLLIVGAGPSGIAAALAAQELGLQAEILEQESDLGGSILHYPRRKVVLSTAVDLPRFGKIRASRMSKEDLLDLFRKVVRETGLAIRFGCPVQKIEKGADGVEVTTPEGVLRAQRVLLCVGRRGTPQKLGIPGEDLAKVAYRLGDPEGYAGTRCLVVGGGDSALEAAVALAEVEGTSVSLAYRGASIWRAKRENLQRFDAAVRQGKVKFLANAVPRRIEPQEVVLEIEGSEVHLLNDAVFVFAGGVLPKKFLEQSGIRMRTVHGEPLPAA